MKPEQQADYDHTFRAIYDNEIPWQEGSKSVLKLPDGVQVKIFAHDKAMGRVDMKVKFPPGYVEPEHAHKSWHSIVVLKGRMCVAGKDLRPGDYVFGWDELHGPYEYPDGCEVFVVFMGESVAHEWDENEAQDASKHLAGGNRGRPTRRRPAHRAAQDGLAANCRRGPATQFPALAEPCNIYFS